MSSSALPLCPSCGMPVSPDAAFCENCGAEIRREEAARPEEGSPHCGAGEGVANEGGASRPGEPETASPSARPEGSLHHLPAAAARPLPPAEPSFTAAPRPSPPTEERVFDAEAPFSLEWDDRRAFIEGVRCNFSFRLRSHARLSKFGIRVEVDGEGLPPVLFSSLLPGDVREGLFPFVPRTPGAISVRFVAEVLYEGGCSEGFESARPFEHTVSPFRRFLSDDSGLRIDIRDNSGLIRLDDLKLPSQTITDLKAEIEKALALRGGWKTAPVAPSFVARERVRLRVGERECLVVAGGDVVTFGASSSRTTVSLAPALRGPSGETCSRYVSGVHFSIRRDRFRDELLLCDGGPSAQSGANRSWRKSTNGTAVDGTLLGEARPLHPGAPHAIQLAPYTVSGGALSLTLETRGYDEADTGFDRMGDVSSALVRLPDDPGRAALVVWGAAPLDPVLGTHAGVRVASIRGRLHAVLPDGSVRRLLLLCGRTIPGTSVFVQ